MHLFAFSSHSGRMSGRQNAWAKPDALLICGDRDEDGEGEICVMEAEPGEATEAA